MAAADPNAESVYNSTVDKPHDSEKEPMRPTLAAVATPSDEAPKLDEFIQLGRYTYLLCILAEFLILNQLSNMFYMMYAGAEAPLVSCGNYTFNATLSTKAKCQILEGLQNNTRTQCTPQFAPQFESVNYEWGYYCSSNKLVKQSVSVQMVGVIIGSIIFGQFSDAAGRKPALLTALVGCIVCMVASSFINNLLAFTIARMVVNIFNGGCIAIQLVYNVENLPKRDRFVITNLITWSPNILIYAGVAYLAGDWRTLTRTSAVLAVPAVIVLLFLCESPRYLIQRREMDKARAAIKRIYRIDGRTLDEGRLDTMLQREAVAAHEVQKKQKRYTYLHLCYTAELTRYTIAIGFSMLTTSLLTYSLLFNMERLSGSMYINSVILGIFRYSLNLFTAFADIRYKWVGRMLVHKVAEAFCILALLFFIMIYALGLQQQLSVVSSLLVLSVMGQTTLMYCTNGILSSELFPTGIRNLSFSFGQVMSRVGVVIAPMLFFLSDFWTPAPYLALLIVASIDWVLFAFNLQETKGKPMRDRMPEKETSWFHSKRLARAAGKEGGVELVPAQDLENNAIASAT